MANFFGNSPNHEEPKFTSVPYQPPPGGDSDGSLNPPNFNNFQTPKRSKTWLWITLAIVTPLFLCCLGIGGCTYFLIESERPYFDVTNEFYAALRDGQNPDPYLCNDLKNSAEFDQLLNDYEENNGKVRSYDFFNIEIVNNEATVTGDVNRSGRDNIFATIDIVEENGEKKVCNVLESGTPRSLNP